jgi:hypothetical protein
MAFAFHVGAKGQCQLAGHPESGFAGIPARLNSVLYSFILLLHKLSTKKYSSS